MNNKLNIMIGFPNTGKTTFLAAFWKYLKDVNNNCFELEQLPENMEYLEKLMDSWLQCELVARTISGKHEEVNLRIKTKDEQIINLKIPDIAGEIYHQLFINREIEKNLYSNLSEANGIMVFINSQLDDVSSYNRYGATTSETVYNNAKVPPFSASETPIRIQLIDVLQTILEINKKDLRLVVVISAWDLISDDISPEIWTQINIPLVYNFIKNNFANFCYFGISAQGGDYANKRDELLGLDSPIHRIQVIEDSNRSNDITLPLQYLVN